MQTFSNIKIILDDLKNSWYFRIYGFFWLFFVVYTFAVLILLGRRSTEAQNEQVFNFWVENATSINFPRFHFRLERGVFTENVACLWAADGSPVQTTACASRGGYNPPFSSCQAVIAENTQAQNTWGLRWKERQITCYFNTNLNATENDLVAFGLEGPNIAHFGFEENSPILIGPNNNTWVLLDKGYITYSGRETREEWERFLIYHSTASQIGVYRVSVILNRFFVTHIEQGDNYDGWMAIGEIGGFGYFLLLMHVLVMMVSGICLNNNSKFLSGDSSTHGSAEERQTIL